MSLAIVGARYENKGRGKNKPVPRKFEIEMCSPGEPIQLVPEPNNPADERAIAVYSVRGIQIGYLTAERASLIGTILTRGEIISAIFQAPTPWGAYIRAAFDGEEPVLPATRALAASVDQAEGRDTIDPDPGFWPDEVWN